MAVRAKFTVTEVAQTTYSPTARRIVLTPQYDTSIPEDRRFSDATPTGEIRMLVNNPVAVEELALGATFYVDFTKAT